MMFKMIFDTESIFSCLSLLLLTDEDTELWQKGIVDVRFYFYRFYKILGYLI